MIIRKLYSVGKYSWLLLALMFVGNLSLLALRATGTIEASAFLYVAQPIFAIALAAITYAFVHGRSDRVRRKTEKATIVGSILVIWFVLYFLSGLLVTYVHNTLVVDARALLFNVFAYGLVAACIEYVRYGTLLMAGRRNVVWFGLIVAVVFALQYVNIMGLATAQNPEDLIKMLVADFVPGLVMSMLLTYLAFSAGLSAQLTYRLGVVAITILPPIIPKYDWYLLGVSSILLAIAIYITVDRHRQSREQRPTRRRNHMARATDIVIACLVVALAMFTSGLFAYKPVTIMSDSMRPVYARGSMVIIRKNIQPVDIQVGDIIQYEREAITITHRVVAINAASDGSDARVFTTKGDNSPSIDPPVTEQQVVGVVRAQVPLVGYPTVWLRELSQ
ncbi:signal peptidase I [Candidatus Saccharibacteria bacterium]|nr:signal peptidase I [Candidatus Saccharibacteria bacterium]